MATSGVTVTGLRELSGALEHLPEEIDKELKTELTAVAEKLAVAIRRRVPRDSGDAAASIVAGVQGQTPFVKGGGPRVPYYGWLDFGSRVPRHHQGIHRGPWTHSGKGPVGGRYMFPTIEAENDEFVKAANAAFDKARIKWFGK